MQIETNKRHCINRGMDAKEFREFGKAAVDFVADYLENIRDDDVLPSVEPGYLLDLLPKEMPEQPESWKEVLGDINRVIKPGLTHWQSPNMHAYYPTSTSYPSIVGEMLASGFGIIGFSWVGAGAGHFLARQVKSRCGPLFGPTEWAPIVRSG